MGIISWLKKSAPPDYETLLSRLASDVHDAKVHLSEIRLRERRFSFIIYLYGLALWGVWAGLWWLGGLPFGLIGWDARGNEARLVGFAGLLLGPVLIYGLGRLHRLYFARQRRYEENHLRKLLAEQKKQVDAIKKATNYDATRKLIEEYDVSNGFASPGAGPADGPVTPQGGKAGSRKGTPQKTPAGSPQATGAGAGAMGGVQGPQTPQGQIVRTGQPAVGTPRAPGHLLGAGGTPMPAGMTAEQAALLHFQPQPVLPTPEKRWYDRVVDSILGEDPSHATQSKYALVCEKCFRHNGLVGTKYEWERMQWICPRCNHLNPAPLSRASSDPSHPANLNTPAQPHPQNRAYPIAAQSPGTPSHSARSSAPQTRARRQLSGLSDGGNGNGSGNGTPRGSRLRQQVMVDEDEDEDEDGQAEQQGSKEGEMEVDE